MFEARLARTIYECEAFIGELTRRKSGHSGNPFRKEKTTSKSHLKKNETLKVNIKNGRWWCPSCGDSNLETKEDCGSCGQKVDKS